MIIYGLYEWLLRGGMLGFLAGMHCWAVLSALGIEADAANKVYPSLPTSAYTRGNI
ncbi:hypothetical protein [Nostoc flagelliforme]|uniref:hypothetical protein n=1 Tax=Nostoc flagelliforme TaxID=1306274 RepID=UPI0018F02C19|nr:hypothetical protein [Nostoc flagelliforme]